MTVVFFNKEKGAKRYFITLYCYTVDIVGYSMGNECVGGRGSVGGWERIGRGGKDGGESG
jgi:hypothetical protein